MNFVLFCGGFLPELTEPVSPPFVVKFCGKVLSETALYLVQFLVTPSVHFS